MSKYWKLVLKMFIVALLAIENNVDAQRYHPIAVKATDSTIVRANKAAGWYFIGSELRVSGKAVQLQFCVLRDDWMSLTGDYKLIGWIDKDKLSTGRDVDFEQLMFPNKATFRIEKSGRLLVKLDKELDIASMPLVIPCQAKFLIQ